MKIAFTGHRPNKLGGYNDATNLCGAVVHLINKEVAILTGLDTEPPLEFIVGMAQGVDTWAALYAIEFGIPFHAYIPFTGQETAWPQKAQTTYHNILKKAASIKVICKGGYAAWKMQVRNEAMVNDCDVLIAIWNRTPGGTANCVQYALSTGRRTIITFPGG